ncbi:hypothetical protein YN1_5180 [Nanoarchaeota archaeon]
MNNQYVDSIYYIYSFIDNKKYEEFEIIDIKTMYKISKKLFKETDTILGNIYEFANMIFEDKNIEEIIKKFSKAIKKKIKK